MLNVGNHNENKFSWLTEEYDSYSCDDVGKSKYNLIVSYLVRYNTSLSQKGQEFPLHIQIEIVKYVHLKWEIPPILNFCKEKMCTSKNGLNTFAILQASPIHARYMKICDKIFSAPNIRNMKEICKDCDDPSVYGKLITHYFRLSKLCDKHEHGILGYIDINEINLTQIDANQVIEIINTKLAQIEKDLFWWIVDLACLIHQHRDENKWSTSIANLAIILTNYLYKTKFDESKNNYDFVASVLAMEIEQRYISFVERCIRARIESTNQNNCS